MKLSWWILLILPSVVLIHALILKRIILYLVRYAEIDAIDYLRYREEGSFFDLMALISKKLAEKNLLLNYRALPLLDRLAENGLISKNMQAETQKIVKSVIDQTTITSVDFNDINICLFNFRLKPFWGETGAAIAYELWRKFLKEQRRLKRALWIYRFFTHVNYKKAKRFI